jgi:hypothetical protein
VLLLSGENVLALLLVIGSRLVEVTCGAEITALLVVEITLLLHNPTCGAGSGTGLFFLSCNRRITSSIHRKRKSCSLEMLHSNTKISLSFLMLHLLYINKLYNTFLLQYNEKVSLPFCFFLGVFSESEVGL